MAVPHRRGGSNAPRKEHPRVSEAFDFGTLSWCSGSLTHSDKVGKAEMWDGGG